jgi:hypothetical protein
MTNEQAPMTDDSKSRIRCGRRGWLRGTSGGDILRHTGRIPPRQFVEQCRHNRNLVRRLRRRAAAPVLQL